MTEKKFYDNKFALVIDLRCTDDNNLVNAGHNVTDTKSGVQLIITKEVTAKDIKGEIFALLDAAVTITGGSFNTLELTHK